MTPFLRSGRYISFFGMLAAFVTACSLAQTAPAPAPALTPTPTLRIGTQLRVLDVTVLDNHGRPVTSGLTKEDFKVTDGKQERQLLSVELNDVRSSTVPPRTVVIIDHLNSTTDQEIWEQKKVREFFAGQAEMLPHETELALLSKDGLQVVQTFTRDRQPLIDATNKLDAKVSARLTGSWSLENFQQTANAMNELSLQVKGFAGRKNVLCVCTIGEGLNMSGQGVKTQDEINAFIRRTADNIVDARMSLFVITPEIQVGDIRFPYGKGPTATVNSNGGGGGVAIGGSDPGAAPSFTVDRTVQSGTDQLLASHGPSSDPFNSAINLGLLAEMSGGTVYVNRNDINVEAQEAIALGSKYYTLSYRPETDQKDGKYVPIVVSFNKPGLHAMTMTGYYALNDKIAQLNAAQNAQIELRQAGQSSLPFHDIEVAAHALKRSPETDTVTFTIMLRPTDLTFEQTPEGPYVGKISVGALSVGGTHDMLAMNELVMAVKAGTLAGSKGTQAKLPVEISVKVPKKTNHVRLVVRDTYTGKMGAFDIDKATAEAAPVTVAASPVPAK